MVCESLTRPECGDALLGWWCRGVGGPPQHMRIGAGVVVEVRDLYAPDHVSGADGEFDDDRLSFDACAKDGGHGVRHAVGAVHPGTHRREDGQYEYRAPHGEGPYGYFPGLVQHHVYPPSVQFARRSHLLWHAFRPARM